MSVCERTVATDDCVVGGYCTTFLAALDLLLITGGVGVFTVLRPMGEASNNPENGWSSPRGL